MEKYPPEYVFNKKYDYNYLYSDSDILWNEEFSSKLFEFTKILNSKSLIFETLNPKEYDYLLEKKIVIDNITTQKIIDTYNINSKIDLELYPFFTFSFYIYDNTEKWKIYVSNCYEIAIFGCDNNIDSLYEVIFKPYEDETLEQKLSWVTDRLYEQYRNDYIKELEKNYNFSKTLNKMIKELPNYVFKKNYDSFYLLTEFDIVFNKKFTEKLNLFCEKINSKNLSITIEVPIEYNSLIPNKIELTNSNNLYDFYEMGINVNGNELLYYMINFFINDSSELFEIYVSIENELSIIGCSNQISSLFEVIFNPYEEENLEQKYKIIGDMFNNEKLKLEFIESLEKNYKFSNFPIWREQK